MKTILYTLILLLILFVIEILLRVFFDIAIGYMDNTASEKIIFAFWSVYSIIFYFLIVFCILSIFPLNSGLKRTLALGIVLAITALLQLEKNEHKSSGGGAWINIHMIDLWNLPGISASREAESFTNRLFSSDYKKMSIDKLLAQPNIRVSLVSDMHQYNGDYYGYIFLWDKRKNSHFQKYKLITINKKGNVIEIPKNYSHFKKILPVGNQLMLQDKSSRNEFYLPNMDFQSLKIDNFPDRVKHIQVFDGYIYGYGEYYSSSLKEANGRIIRFNDKAVVEVVSQLKAPELFNKEIYGFRSLSNGHLWILSYDKKQKRLQMVQLDKKRKVIQTTPHQIQGDNSILYNLYYNSKVDENGHYYESTPFDYSREFQPQIDSNGNVLILGITTFTKGNTLLRISKEGIFDKKFNQNIAKTDFEINSFNFIENEEILIAGHKNERFVVAIVNSDGILIQTIYEQGE